MPQTADDVVIANGHAITVDTAAVGSSLDITAGNATTSVSINTGQSLTISGSVNISAAALINNRNKALSVGPGSLVIGGNLTLTGGAGNRLAALVISTGTAAIGGSIGITALNAVTCNIIFTGNGALNLGGNFANGASFTAGTGTMVYAGTVNQNMGSYTYNNLTLSGNGTTKFATGGVTVNGNFTNNTGVAFDAGSFTHNLMGNLSNSGAFAAGTSTFNFAGTANQTIDGATTFNNLNMNNTGTGLTLNSDIAVNSQLALNLGRITTGANKVSIGATGVVNGATAASYVFGNLEKNFSAVGPFTFDIGDAANYTPVQIDFTALTTAGALTASTTAAEHPQIAGSGINPGRNVNRFWRMTSATVAGIYNAIFNFIAADVDPAANTVNFIVQRNAASTWFDTALNAANATSTSISGVNGFGDFAIGEPVISNALLERELIYVQEVFD